MALIDKLFSAAQSAARFLKATREPLSQFNHDTGSIKGWEVCTPDSWQGVGWTARTDIILTSDGELYSFYVRSVSVADTEGRTPCRTLRPISKEDPWSAESKRVVLKKLQEMIV